MQDPKTITFGEPSGRVINDTDLIYAEKLIKGWHLAVIRTCVDTPWNYFRAFANAKVVPGEVVGMRFMLANVYGNETMWLNQLGEEREDCRDLDVSGSDVGEIAASFNEDGKLGIKYKSHEHNRVE